MRALLSVSAIIDRILGYIGRIGAWAGLLLVLVVVYDVVTRYFGVSKEGLGTVIGAIFGLGPNFELNSTKVQESEYWLHTILFTFMIGFAYTNQAHVRIDLVRDRLSLRAKYLLEVLGCLLFLLPFAAMAIYYHYAYAHASYLEGEVSKSVIGLSNIWILKSTLTLMFVLLFLAGISQLFKSIAGLFGALPEEMVTETLGGDN